MHGLYPAAGKWYTIVMESIVSLRRCQDYEAGRPSQVVRQLIDDLGGIGAFVRRGERVLLKPNLLMAYGPDRAVVTHPAVVEAVAALAIDAGATVAIGDSPSIGSLQRVLAKSGYEPFMSRLGLKPAPFKEKVTIACHDGRMFRKLELAKTVFEFDRVISLAKLKTHSQMLLTLAIKNLFGTVVGSDKASWHLQAGKDTDGFAMVLAQIYEEVKPTLSLVDGVLGMEGNGPSGGLTRWIGIMAGSTDAVALDATICRLVGFPVEKLRTCVVAQTLGIGTTERDRIALVGDGVDGFPLKDFKPPKSMTVTWNLSQRNPVRRFLENHLVARPRIDANLCSHCKVCMNHCPPGAISERNGQMAIDRRSCISCFCCQELCTSKAIDVVHPLFGRIVSRVVG